MHDGNIAFVPNKLTAERRLKLAPLYDMLPMAYAPERGVEVVARVFNVTRPLPSETLAWLDAAKAACTFWSAASQDARISSDFRQVCSQNARALQDALQQEPTNAAP
jgi:hypothetical protein